MTLPCCVVGTAKVLADSADMTTVPRTLANQSDRSERLVPNLSHTTRWRRKSRRLGGVFEYA